MTTPPATSSRSGALRSLARRLAILFTRAVRGLSPDSPSGVALAEFRGRSVAIRRGTADEEVLEGFRTPFYLPDAPPGTVRVAINAGGHIGLAAIEIADGHPEATVHVLEPHPDSLAMLRINVALTGLADRVRPHQAALGDIDGAASLRLDGGNWGHSTVARHRGRTIPVDSITLPTFLDRQGIATCDLLVANCEGAEFGIVAACDDATLRRVARWVLLVHEDIAGRPRSELIDRLGAVGFSVRELRSRSDRCWVVAERR